jgi:hypothetical protein
MLTAAMASDRTPDASNDENRDDSNTTELNSKGASAQDNQAERAATSDAPRRAKTRRVVEEELEDDDEYDDDEEEDEEELLRRERARRARAKKQASRRRGPKKKRNIPTTEEELNVPKLQTIGMLASVSVLLVIMWFAARLACNAHPDHIRDPRYVSVEQLSRDPKNAALEFELRFTSKDLLLAGEIATGEMADKIRELLRNCEGNMESCEHDRQALKNKVTGSVALLEMNPKRATAEVTTYVSNENPHTSVLDLVLDGQVWKVAQARDAEKKSATPGAPGVNANASGDAGLTPQSE